jgi:hypothetical protein
MGSTKFTEKVRAQAFVRDRAVCCYTGEKLWLADSDGVAPQCDHFVPVSKGGANTLENAVSCFYIVNNDRRANDAPSLRFAAGRITREGTAHYGGAIPDHIARYLDRMSNARLSDWYLNEAFNNCNLGLRWLLRCDRAAYDRNDEWYASAALRRLNDWRKHAHEAADALPEKRGLAPHDGDPRTGILWEARHCKSVTQLRDAMSALQAHEETEGRVDVPLGTERLVNLFNAIADALSLNRSEFQRLSDVLSQHGSTIDAIGGMVPYLKKCDDSIRLHVKAREDVTARELLRLLQSYMEGLDIPKARAKRIINTIETRYGPTIHAITAALGSPEPEGSRRRSRAR